MMKGELQDLGEEYDDVQAISKIQTQLLNLTDGAVNIFDDSGNFKSTYEIMQDIADVYFQISQTDQADLLEIIAGKNRANEVATLLQAYSSGQVQSALASSQNSEGSAQAEQDKWMDSLEAKINTFKAAFQELSTTTLNSDFLKGAIDAGTVLLEVLTQIISVGSGIPALLGGAGIAGFVKNLA